MFAVAFAVASVVVLLAYTFVTKHIWEDFFITFRCSENLVDGNGLVYEVGKRIHAFTSPLGVLLPAFCHWATGERSYLTALWCFRVLFCVPAFAGAGIMAMRLLAKAFGEKWRLPCVFLALFLLADVKAVAFSMNGMETALMLFFLAWALNGLLEGDGRFGWLSVGAAWSGLMWTRPDSCVYIAAVGVALLIFPHSGRPRKETLLSLAKSAAVTTALYLPWFLWTWWYYGSPIPHTVVAKSAVNGFSLVSMLSNWLPHAAWAFGPVYAAWAGPWPFALELICAFLALFAMFYWVLPVSRSDSFGRRVSLCFLIVSAYYAAMGAPYPWYYPPFAMIGSIVVVNGFLRLGSLWERRGRVVAVVALSIVFVDASFLFMATVRQMQCQQALIETGLRKQIGLWLKENARRDDTIYLECLGYIGYFSGGRMLDYPGLASPSVVDAVKKVGPNMTAVLLELSPNWAVLRAFEAKTALKNPAFRKRYQYVCHFSAAEKLDKVGAFQGVEYLWYDSTFVVYKRRKNGDRLKQSLRIDGRSQAQLEN
jgi:hypothetical protein